MTQHAPTIDPATPADAAGIATVHIRAWQAAYAQILDPAWLAGLSIERRATQWARVLADGTDSRVAVARDGGRITAFVSHGRCRDDGAAPTRGEIMTLYALPEVWGQGTGRALLDHALGRLQADGFDTASLWVLAANQRAIRFYAAAGFVAVPGSAQQIDVGGRSVEEVAFHRALQPASAPSPGRA